jgi:hypothetical protein
MERYGVLKLTVQPKKIILLENDIRTIRVLNKTATTSGILELLQVQQSLYLWSLRSRYRCSLERLKV